MKTVKIEITLQSGDDDDNFEIERELIMQQIDEGCRTGKGESGNKSKYCRDGKGESSNSGNEYRYTVTTDISP